MHAQSDNPTRDVIVSRKLPYYNIENSQYTILQIKNTNKGIAYFEFIVTLIYYYSLILHFYSLFKLGKSDDVTIILLKNCSDVE